MDFITCKTGVCSNECRTDQKLNIEVKDYIELSVWKFLLSVWITCKI